MLRGPLTSFVAACLVAGCTTNHAGRQPTAAQTNRQLAKVLASGATVPNPPSTVRPWSVLGEVDFLDARFGWAPVARSCGEQACISVYMTDDGGDTWAARTVDPMRFDAGDRPFVRPRPMVRLASREIGWLVDEQGRLFVTNDGSATWRTEPTVGAVIELQAHGQDVWRLEKVCRQQRQDCHVTLMISSDYGRSWAEAHPPEIGTTGASLVWPSRQVGYILSDRGDTTIDNRGPDSILARTTDGGGSWTTLRPPCSGYNNGGDYEGPGSGGWDLAASAPQDLWLVCQDTAASGSMQPKRLFRSSDGGVTWSPDLGTPNSGAGGYTVAASPKRACRGASQTSITCTRDGGRSWFVPIANGAESPYAAGLVGVYQFADDRHGWAFGEDETTGDFTALWHTADGGESWSRQHVT
jgi:photosystem II stability/assembly factor-like uncharacterized protein